MWGQPFPGAAAPGPYGFAGPMPLQGVPQASAQIPLTAQQQQMSAMQMAQINQMKMMAQMSQIGQMSGTLVNLPPRQLVETQMNGTCNLNSILSDTITNNNYFISLIADFPAFEQVVDVIRDECTHLSVFEPGKGHNPSVAFCCMYRLAMIQLDESQLKVMLEHTNPFVRCVALLWLRNVGKVENLIEQCLPHLEDDTVICPFSDKKESTVGKWLLSVITDSKYCDTVLRRIPIPIVKQFEKRAMEIEVKRERLERMTKHITAGFKCEAKWTDGNTYAVNVDSVLDGGKFLVTYTQYGNQEEITVNDFVLESVQDALRRQKPEEKAGDKKTDSRSRQNKHHSSSRSDDEQDEGRSEDEGRGRRSKSREKDRKKDENEKSDRGKRDEDDDRGKKRGRDDDEREKSKKRDRDDDDRGKKRDDKRRDDDRGSRKRDEDDRGRRRDDGGRKGEDKSSRRRDEEGRRSDDERGRKRDDDRGRRRDEDDSDDDDRRSKKGDRSRKRDDRDDSRELDSLLDETTLDQEVERRLQAKWNNAKANAVTSDGKYCPRNITSYKKSLSRQFRGGAMFDEPNRKLDLPDEGAPRHGNYAREDRSRPQRRGSSPVMEKKKEMTQEQKRSQLALLERYGDQRGHKKKE